MARARVIVAAFVLLAASSAAAQRSPAYRPTAGASAWQTRGGHPLARPGASPRVTPGGLTLSRNTSPLAAHAEDLPSRPEWGVFDDGEHGAEQVVDEAWRRARAGEAPGVVDGRGARTFDVDLGRRVGVVGGREGAARGFPETHWVRVVVAGDNRLVTAYPVPAPTPRAQAAAASRARATQSVAAAPRSTRTTSGPSVAARGHASGDSARAFFDATEHNTNDVTANAPDARPVARGAGSDLIGPEHLVRWAATYRAPAGARPPRYARSQPTRTVSRTALRDALVRASGTAPSIAEQAAPQVELGLPSAASQSRPNDFLLVRRDHVLSYNRAQRGPNWVSWRVTRSDYGQTPRQDDFRPDPTLPDGWAQATRDDYREAHGPVHIGHMIRSGERTGNARANSRTFVMSNTVPQARDSNTGPWFGLERYVQELVEQSPGREVLVVAGPVWGANAVRIGEHGVAVPQATFKVAVVLEAGQSLRDVRDARVIAAIIPNYNRDVNRNDHWADYRVTPRDVERATGLQLFTSLPATVADTLRDRLDTAAVPYTPPPDFSRRR